MGPDIVKLLPEFDASTLQEELFALGGERFKPQATYSEGEITQSLTDGWRVLSLRGPGGDPERTDPGGPGLVDYADTPLIQMAPYTASILKGLNVPLRAVRYMTLEPGASVAEHTDYPYGLPVGWARLHLPIVTNDQAVLVIDGVENRWQPGELWYANFGRPHHLYNRGSQPRVHLVVDCYVSETLLDLFPARARQEMDPTGIMFWREEITASSDELCALTGPVTVPAGFIEAYAEPPSPEEFESAGADLQGTLQVANGRLVLHIDGLYESALVCVGEREFRPLCWTEERTMKFETVNGVPRISFRYRHGSYQTEIVRSNRPGQNDL
ncbi:aspartyl/asparaginyl beta-hydroxylase domain-containing protein [Streptomyces sp. NPDC006984]|uniref:aspartyl/asparaginyl beta-hydroxylase domain-containing protein n=1 Tax=Streptomyces sp. NPDC006984 TaxID=3155463 RepID=UPI0033E1745C